MFNDLWQFGMPHLSSHDWLREFFEDVLEQTDTSDIRAVPHGTFPMVNIGSTDEAVYVYIFAPGIDPDKLELSIQGNVLMLHGQRHLPKTEDHTQRWPIYHRHERVTGEFSRVLTLPDGVDSEAVEATSKDGIIQIKIPKHKQQQRRKISVTAHS